MTTWIKLHNNFFRNPKVLAAGEDAALLYIQGLVYCSDSETDGAIPTPALRMLTARKDVRTLAKALVREGLWTETATGWLVHDYLKVQRSKAQIEAEREATRTRVARHRSRSGNADTATVTNGDVTAPDTETDTDSPSVPPEVWTEYARVQAMTSLHPIADFDKWSIPVIKQAKAAHSERAAYWCRAFNAAPRQIAMALHSGDCRSLEPYKRKAGS